MTPALPGAAVALAALGPVGALAIAFPEGGSEPFGLGRCCRSGLAALALPCHPRRHLTLRAGIAVYALATIAVYLVPSPIGPTSRGSGAFWPRRWRRCCGGRSAAALLAAAVLPLLYVGWQAPVADVAATAGDPSTTAAYYRPLLAFLARQPGPPFRIEIPFTASHWEAYYVARRFPIARGWERQLDLADNPLFYRPHLTADAYEAWLHRDAIRFVAVPDVSLDYSAVAERRLIDRGLPDLRLVMRSRHWRVYAVAEPTPIVTGAARLRAIGGDWLTLTATAPGTVSVRVRFTPYWAIIEGYGCVAPQGADTRLTLRRAGPVRLATRFALSRIGARSPRCN